MRITFRPETAPRAPWPWLKWLVGECHDFVQRGWRGYADVDVWNYGAYIARISEPMLNTWLQCGVGFHGDDEKAWLDRLESWRIGMDAGRLYWTHINSDSIPMRWGYLSSYRKAMRDIADHVEDLWG